ncbi:MAG: WXG100 family type VII secretion target [Lachnospiraceae bacterium]|nr:WXG100 family type VII secretion target [Lachnospiraceae bacterium]
MDEIRIKASSQALYTGADEVQKTVTDLKNRFSVIETAVTGSTGYWIGDAGDAHREAYNDMKGTVDDILNRLAEHAADLKLMAAGYEEAEGSTQEMASGLPEDVIF